jgi:hypothetical protein
VASTPESATRTAIDWSAISSPIIFQGDATTAYRDPAAVCHAGTFHLFFTLVQTEADGKVFSYTAKSTSCDLVRWSPPTTFTPRDQSLNYCSPGNVIRFQGQWVLCLSMLFHAPHNGIGVKRSKDLRHWLLARIPVWTVEEANLCLET